MEKERGVQAKNVEVAYFGDVDDTAVMRYRGMKAMGRVNEGDVLCELPRESCPRARRRRRAPFPRLLHQRALGQARGEE